MKRNYIPSNYGLYDCYKCLCEVCTRVGCPKIHRKSKISHCIAMRQRGVCPTVKCDWFTHKEKHKVYRIIRKRRKVDIIDAKLNEIINKLDCKGTR